ncbi:MAG: UDP-glucose 4-epimerase GalE [Coriobacteriia bacterium]
MRILVTGGAGYIGSITTRTLLDSGHDVIVLDSLERGHIQAVDPRAELAIADVDNRAALDAMLPGCDAVMHLAGLIEVAESQREPERYRNANVEQPAVMLAAMAEHGVSTLVFSSTAAVYGEPAALPITEETPTAPINVYGESKLAFERMLDDEAADHGLRSIRFRYFNVAGALPDGSLGEAHDPETHIIPRALNSISRTGAFEIFGDDYDTPDGTCVRDYIHVTDLAAAHRIALEVLAGGHAGGVYNLGNGEGFSNLQVAQACGRVLGREVDVHFGPRREGDPARLVASSARARRELGWVPEHSDLDAIVADAWRWHVEAVNRGW